MMRFYFLIPFILLSNLAVTQNKYVLLRNPYLYMSNSEVSNREYNEFLEAVKSENFAAYRCYLPDTNQWGVAMGYAEDYKLYYHRHPAYLNYPVVNISYESAKAYCEWLTTKINQQNEGERSILVRLPTEVEWEQAAQASHDGLYPWDGNLPWKKEGSNAGKMLANFKRGKGDMMGVAGSLNDGADITNVVKSYPPNSLGLYDMAGNVAEMILEKGIVKGGSWNSRFDELKIKHRDKIDTTSPEVGFRYVVEVVKVPKCNEVKTRLTNSYFKENFVKLNDTLYGGKYEVNNAIFKFYLDRNDMGKSCYGWDSLFTYSSFYQNNYFDGSNYVNYPVVNITKDEAEDFCRWLTENYWGKENLKFRLPTEKEWLLMAEQKHSNYPWKRNSLRDKKGSYKANFCPKKSIGFLGEETMGVKHIKNFDDLKDYDGYGVLAPVVSFKRNKKGIYNLAGNVAEIIEDKEYTKGGSWGSPGDQLQVRSHEEYELPSAFVGFRIVAEIKN